MAVSHYRSMATEAAQKARESKSLGDISEFCRQRRSYIALAEAEELATDPRHHNDPLPTVADATTPSEDVRWAKIYIEK